MMYKNVALSVGNMIWTFLFIKENEQFSPKTFV